MLKTRTGNFDLGFRRGWSDWQRDLAKALEWSKANDLGVIDLGSDANELAAQVNAAGLRVGSADLKGWQGLISDDKAKLDESISQNADYISACAAEGISNFFAVMLPADPAKSRADNFKLMVTGLQALAPHLEKHGAKLVVEGWPGPGALACTPEGYRAMIREVPSPAIGINYDPSHLLRMGIDPIRFVEEFASRVFHIHGKDTEIIAEAVYEYGTEQPPTHGKEHGFGSTFWRYTIPGHGVMRWGRAFEILAKAGYKGAVCIELEDENFNGSEAGEKQGILSGARFLASV